MNTAAEIDQRQGQHFVADFFLTYVLALKLLNVAVSIVLAVAVAQSQQYLLYHETRYKLFFYSLFGRNPEFIERVRTLTYLFELLYIVALLYLW